MLEYLESRLLLTVSLSEHVLTVTGGVGDDQISISQDAGQIEVVGDRSFRASRVQLIVVWCGGGNDTVQLRNIDIPASLHGGRGNDSIIGGKGNDTLFGGRGDDTLAARGGDDLLDGGPGQNLLRGGGGTDTVTYESCTAVSMGLQAGLMVAVALPDRTDTFGANIEDVTGSPGDDLLVGTAAANKLRGVAGNDTIQAVGAGDTLDGDEGDDTLMVSPEFAALMGGGGTNTADFSARTADLTITLDDVANDGAAGENMNVGRDIQAVIGGSGNDSITGNELNNSLAGGAGDDTLDGGLGSDTLLGGAGRDLADYSARTDNLGLTIDGQADSGAPAESDLIGTDVENLRSGSGNDSLTGSAADNQLDGGAGNDTLTGLDGNDTLVGGDGDDRLLADAGADVLAGGSGTDLADYSARTEDLSLSIDGQADSGAAGENDAIGTDIEDLAAGSGNDSLTGSDAANELDGGAGNDTLTGLDGNDTLRGGAGNDSLLADAGADVLSGGADTDLADYSARITDLTVSLDDEANDGAAGENDNVMSDVENIDGGSGNDHLIGSSAINVLFGNGGNDTLDGGPGTVGDNDTLWGGDGFDIADYSSRTGPQQLRIGEGSGIPGEKDIPEHDIEGLWGGSGDDWLQGDGSNNLLIGNAGNDTMLGMAGNDTLIGGAGADLLGHDGQHDPTITDSGDDILYTNVAGNNNDGSIDIINDAIGNNTLNYSITDPDSVL